MARLMISMPDEMVKKLDRRAKQERCSRSELLREAVERHLSALAPGKDGATQTSRENGKQKIPKRWRKKALERHLLGKGMAQTGCLGLDSLVRRRTGRANMNRVLRVTKKLNGLSRQIIDDREDRV